MLRIFSIITYINSRIYVKFNKIYFDNIYYAILFTNCVQK